VDKEIHFEVDLPQKTYLEEHEGFRLLWIKVIARAAYDWVLYRDSKSRYYKRLAESAHAWLFDIRTYKRRIVHNNEIIEREYEPANSLNVICDYLDIDAEEVRKFAKRLTRREIRKLEFFNRVKKEGKIS
jgi:hypothetical protein